MRGIFPAVFILFPAGWALAQSLPDRDSRNSFPVTSTVGDFTIITTAGDTLNLYNTLASGKTVFIDLFYTRCVNCQLHAPIIEEIYQNTGAGQEDIVFWGISDDIYDTDSIIDLYKTAYGISNPCAGPQGNGEEAFATITAGQNFFGYPTYCVICPDHTMFFDPVYPPTVSGFDPYFEQCAETTGILDKPEYHPGPRFRSVFPNPSAGPVSLVINNGGSAHVTLEVRNIMGEMVRSEEYHISGGDSLISLDTGETENGIYLLVLLEDGLITDKKILIINR